MRGTNYRKLANQKLHEWMKANNLEGDYIIHHRDDNDDVVAYNKAHYKMWGHNLDGTFEYGKYVVFMTRSEHASHHHTGKVLSEEHKKKLRQNHADVAGNKNPMYGRQHTEEARTKNSESHKGKQHSESTKAKMSESHTGKHHSDDTKQKMKFIKDVYRLRYIVYKQNGGLLSWNAFQRALKNSDITL